LDVRGARPFSTLPLTDIGIRQSGSPDFVVRGVTARAENVLEVEELQHKEPT
jgi:hypothetical protein